MSKKRKISTFKQNKIKPPNKESLKEYQKNILTFVSVFILLLILFSSMSFKGA